MMEREDGVNIFRFWGAIQRVERMRNPGTRHHAPPFPDPEIAVRLSRLVKDFQPDIIHAHNWMLMSHVGTNQSRRSGNVLTLHDYSRLCATQRLMHKSEVCAGPAPVKCLRCASRHYGVLRGPIIAGANRLMQPIQRTHVDLYIPVSRAVAEGSMLASAGLSHRVIPNFVADDVGSTSGDVDQYAQLLPAQPFILFVGDLGREKGLPILLTAYAGLPDAPPLVLIGRPLAEHMPTLPSNVTVLRNWPHEAVMEAWRRCLFGVVPSVWPDPCPTVAMEAMAVGRAVVASAIGGLTDIIQDGHTGLLVPPGDANPLRGALRALLAAPDRRQAMGRQALQNVRSFQASTVVPLIEAAYFEVLQRKSIAPGAAGTQPVEARSA
jgi:glycosyltransferase involved in cell wall biosynthesis